MDCDRFREMLSAQLDGEDGPGERAFAEAHMRTCAGCRQWLDDAAAVTRLVRTHLVSEPSPDLSDAILANLPQPGRRRLRLPRIALPRLVPALRILLGTLGAVQILLGVAQIASASAQPHQHGAGHLWHESAAWNVAVGAGFMWIVLRQGRAAGMVPTLTAFIAVLTLLTANDMMVATVDAGRVLSHGFMVAGYLAVLLLVRATRDSGTPPSAREDGQTDRTGTRSAENVPHPRPSLRLLPGGPTARVRTTVVARSAERRDAA